jgi:general stress protein 26
MSGIEGKIDRVWALMQEIGVAMVVTHTGRHDELRARPMGARPDANENAIYFLTDAGAPKDAEVERNANICLAFADLNAQKFVSVTGEARISNDRAKIKQLWWTMDKMFWRDENDPAIRILRVAPEDAEYWEGPGFVLSAVKMLAAGVAGGRPELADNQKVRLAKAARG